MIQYYITKDYCLYLKSFKPILLIGTIIVFWLNIIVSIKSKSLLVEKNINNILKKKLRPILTTLTFVLL